MGSSEAEIELGGVAHHHVLGEPLASVGKVGRVIVLDGIFVQFNIPSKSTEQPDVICPYYH